MIQITLRQIPENLNKQLRILAQQNNTSLNKTIICLLQKALGLPENSRKARDLSDLKGTWDSAQADEFEANIKFFEQIDREIWESRRFA